MDISKIRRYCNNIAEVCEENQSADEIKRAVWMLTAIVATHLKMSATELTTQILNAEKQLQGRKGNS